MIFIALVVLCASTNAFNISNPYITVYGDVHKDGEFFTRTFPWLIDNIGGELFVDFYLLGSGRYSVPQMCALRDLQGNTFLQAQYLRCEAKGYPSGYCLCEAGIHPGRFKDCVVFGGRLAGSASAKFSALHINFSPIIELKPNSTVFGVDDVSFLMNICTIFGDNLPRGCVQYSNQTEGFLQMNALAQFDRDCEKEFPIDDDKLVTPTTVPPNDDETSSPTLAPSTPDWWSTTPPWWWSTTTSTQWPTDGTTSRPDLTTSTPDWWYTTRPWWWSTTPWATRPTLTPWSTPRPTDGSTSRPDLTTSTPDWWYTTPPWWWSTTPWVTRPTLTPWSTPRPTDGSTSRPDSPTSTPDWWYTTPPWWWSTTPWATRPTITPWLTTPPPWWLTTPPATRTTPQFPTTTTRPTLWPTWWPTRTTPSNWWTVKEEIASKPVPE